jgi:hypothetical protein
VQEGGEEDWAIDFPPKGMPLSAGGPKRGLEILCSQPMAAQCTGFFKLIFIAVTYTIVYRDWNTLALPGIGEGEAV